LNARRSQREEGGKADSAVGGDAPKHDRATVSGPRERWRFQPSRAQPCEDEEPLASDDTSRERSRGGEELPAAVVHPW
jgi:hypothetical protein